MQPDPYATGWVRVAEAIVATPGTLPEGVRCRIARGDDPPELASLLDKVRRHAYLIDDGDLAGIDVDTLYESALAAAWGVADEQRRRALEAIG